MMQKNKGEHLKANVKKRIDGQRDNKRMQNVDHDWPKDKKKMMDILQIQLDGHIM